MPNRSFLQHWRDLGHSTAFLLASFVLVGLVLTIVTIHAIVDTYREVRRQAEANALALVTVLASDLASQLQSFDLFLQQLARGIDATTLRLPTDAAASFDLPAESALRQSLRGVAILDATGALKDSLGLEFDAPLPTERARLLQWHANASLNEAFISKPSPALQAQQPEMLYLSRGLRRLDGSLAGAVIGIFDQSALLARIESLALSERDGWMLVRADGEILLRMPRETVQVQPELRAAVQHRYLGAPTGVFRGPSITDGVDRVHAYREVSGFPAAVVLGRNIGEIVAPWRSKAILLATLVVLLDAALIALVWLWRRDVLRHRQAHRESQRNEALFRGAMRGAGIGTLLYDPDGKIVHVNPAACRMLGYDESELLGTSWVDYTHPDPGPPNPGIRHQLVKGDLEFYESVRRLVRKDGSDFWALISLSADHLAQSGPVLIAQIQNIDDRIRAEEARDALLAQLNATTRELNDEKSLLQVTLATIGDAVITTDVRGRVRFMNPAAESTTGWPLPMAYGRPLSEVARLHDLETELRLPDLVTHCLSLRDGFSETAVLRSNDGGRREIEARVAPIRGPDQEIVGVVLVYQDVTEARVLQRELLHFSAHDALTGLPNRSAFQVRVEAKLRDAYETGRTHVLVHLDLDRFKLINDIAGSAAGDACLRQVAATLRARLREDDFLARLGSDEFGVILCDCHIEQGRPVVERMLTALAETEFPWEDRTYALHMSAGVTEISGTADSVSVLMGEADIACYAAKRGGGNRVQLYQPGHGEALQRQRELHVAADLRQAISEDRFVLYAQRIFACQDPDELRYEVLLRMKCEQNGVIAPIDFVPVAEHYDMMVNVDRWVLKESLQALAPRIASVPQLRLHVNLSANSLNDPGFLKEIISLVRSSPLAPEMLTFEITETALVSNMSHATRVISALRHMGCAVALDDFGIGLSSFSYLRTFPVDLVKIDGSFICNMAHSAVDRSIAQSIHSIARVLGAQTIAEAVEDMNTFEVVKSLEIEYAQGYGLHRPEPLEDILEQHAAQYGSPRMRHERHQGKSSLP